MRILVFSDTHGSIERALSIYNKFNKENHIDYIIHCGDHISDALSLEEEVKPNGTKVSKCYGNCDSGHIGSFSTILETECGNIFITHGDQYGVNWDLLKLGYAAQSNGCNIAVFGHTHHALYEKSKDITFMNPGSLTRPRDGSGGTFGLLVTSEDGFWGRIYRYDDF